MSKVVLYMSMSVDGFITGPQDGVDAPMGIDGFRLFNWLDHRFDDPQLATLVGELSVRDADFRTWWAAHHVTSTGNGTKHYRHAVVGDLVLDCDTWVSPEDPDQRILILTAEPGSPSHDGLRILASWTTEAIR